MFPSLWAASSLLDSALCSTEDFSSDEDQSIWFVFMLLKIYCNI